MAVSQLIEEVSQLVRDRDAVLAERTKATAAYDAKLRTLEIRMARLMNAKSPSETHDAESPREGSVKQRVLKLLRERPTLDYGELATTVYDEDNDKTRNRVRSIVHALKKDGYIKGSSEPGKWELAA